MINKLYRIFIVLNVYLVASYNFMEVNEIKVVEVITIEGKLRYMVVNQQGEPIPEVLKFLKYKDNSGAARNTLRTVSYHLKLFYEFLEQEELKFQDMSIDNMASFLRWLKEPYRYGNYKKVPLFTLWNDQRICTQKQLL